MKESHRACIFLASFLIALQLWTKLSLSEMRVRWALLQIIPGEQTRDNKRNDKSLKHHFLKNTPGYYLKLRNKPKCASHYWCIIFSIKTAHPKPVLWISASSKEFRQWGHLFPIGKNPLGSEATWINRQKKPLIGILCQMYQKILLYKILAEAEALLPYGGTQGLV